MSLDVNTFESHKFECIDVMNTEHMFDCIYE